MNRGRSRPLPHRHRRLADHDPSSALGFRRRDPVESVRSVQPVRGRATACPTDFIRSVNATDPDTNAWALLERNDVDPEEFDALFADESEALGHRIPGADVLGLLSGEIRPEMVDGARPGDPRRLPHGVPHQQRRSAASSAWRSAT